MTTEREAFEAWWGESPVELTPLVNQSTQDKHNAWVWRAWQASRKVAFTDAMVLATVGATYPELMEYMQGELK